MVWLKVSVSSGAVEARSVLETGAAKEALGLFRLSFLAGLARMQKIQKLEVVLEEAKIGPEPRRSECCRHMRSMQLSTESLSRVEAEESFKKAARGLVRAAMHKSFGFASRLVCWRSLWYGIMRWRLKDVCWASDAFGLRVRLASGRPAVEASSRAKTSVVIASLF